MYGDNRPYSTPSRQRGRRAGGVDRPKSLGNPITGGVGFGESVKDDPPNILVLILSILIGLSAQIVCNILYNHFLMSIPRPILIGMLFLILSVAVVLVVFIVSHVKGYYQDDLMDGVLPFGDRTPLVLAMLILSIFLLATLFQFIYGLGGLQKQSEPTSYVFVLDDSESMLDTDPEQKRFSAIEEILVKETEDFPYMVYRFSDIIEVAREMAPQRDGNSVLTGNNEGGTSIKGALQRVIEDEKNGVWDGGDHPRVIMLTDGYATDLSFMSSISGVLRDYRKSGISISTVGLGEVDEGLMNKIAKETGGVFISVDEASQLSSEMRNAAILSTDRDLLTTRYTQGLNVLYAVMRIICLTILGIIIGIATMTAYGDEESRPIALATTGITALVGALLMELGTNLFAWDEEWIWRFLWILFALTLVLKHKGFESFRQRDLTPTHRGEATSIGGRSSSPYS